MQQLHQDAFERQAKSIRSDSDRIKLNGQLRDLKDRQESVEKDRTEIQEAVSRAQYAAP